MVDYLHNNNMEPLYNVLSDYSIPHTLVGIGDLRNPPKYSKQCDDSSDCQFRNQDGAAISTTCNKGVSEIHKTCDPQWNGAPPGSFTTAIKTTTSASADFLRGDIKIMTLPPSDGYMRPHQSYELVLHRPTAVFGTSNPEDTGNLGLGDIEQNAVTLHNIYNKLKKQLRETRAVGGDTSTLVEMINTMEAEYRFLSNPGS